MSGFKKKGGGGREYDIILKLPCLLPCYVMTSAIQYCTFSLIQKQKTEKGERKVENNFFLALD